MALSAWAWSAQASAQTVDASALPPIQPRTASQTASSARVPLLLASSINGRDVGMQAVQRLQDTLYMRRSDLQALGIQPEVLDQAHAEAGPTTDSHDNADTNASDPWLDLASLPGVQVQFQSSRQQLALQLPISALNWPSTELKTRDRTAVHASASPGVALNYDLYGMRTRGSRTLSATTELRGFYANGVFSNNLLHQYAHNDGSFSKSGNHYQQTRLDSTFTLSWPDNMLSLRLGDVLTGMQPWSRSTRLGGIQLARNFGLQPYRNTAPIPALMGTSALPSDIALYINGVQQYQGHIPAGPFNINTAPGISGTGDAQVVLTDALGRQTRLQYDFYGTNDLLAQGLSDWSAELGLVRKSYGLRSFDYGSDPVVSGSWSYGLSNTLTLQAHGEATRKLGNLGGGASWRVGMLGVLSAAAAASEHRGRQGHLLQLGHQWSNRRFSTSLQGTRASESFRDAASLYDSMRQRSSGRAMVGYSHPQWGSFNTGLVYQHNFEQESQRFATFGWSKTLGQRCYLSVNVNHNLNDSKQSSAQVLLTWALGDNLNAGVSVGRQNDHNTFNTYATQSRPSSGGWGWSAMADHSTRNQVQGRLDYLGRSFEANAAVAQNGGDTSTALGLSGALVAMGGHIYPSRRLYEGFALVSTNGIADVPIKRENNLIGHTDRNGMLLVTQLGSYRNNKISIDPMALSAQLRVPDADQQVAPTDRAGTLVQFDIERIRPASVILVDPLGQPLALGSVARVRHAGAPTASGSSLVGFDGLAYFDNLQAHSELEVRGPQGQRCRALLDYPETADNTVPTIGPLPCQPE